MKKNSETSKINKPILFFEDVIEKIDNIPELNTWGLIKRSDCINYVVDKILDDLATSIKRYINEFKEEQNDCAMEIIIDNCNQR